MIDFTMVNENDLEVIKHYNKIKEAVEVNKVDFLEKNKDVGLAHPVTKMHMLRRSGQLQDEKRLIFQGRKAQLEKKERKRKLLLCHKWDFIKQKKEEFQQDALEKVKDREHTTRWAKSVTNLLCIKYVYERFASVRDAYHLAVAKDNAVMRIARCWRRYRAQLFCQNKLE